MNDSRETKLTKAFVAGYPIKHSRSPLIHNYWLAQMGIDGRYEPLSVAPGEFEQFIANLKGGESGYQGGNITIPHKENAYRLADAPDELSRELGAANTLWLHEGRLHATNTDGHGFVSNLDERSPGWDKAEKALVLGAGGAARAVIQAIRDRGIPEVHVVNRTVARARELADRFGPRIHAHPIEALREVASGAALFVNTTSLGMSGEPVPQMPFDRLAADAVVTDIVYVPLLTPILKQAQARGLTVVDGLGMLLHQAVPGFERWFDRRPQVSDDLRNLIIADMEQHA